MGGIWIAGAVFASIVAQSDAAASGPGDKAGLVAHYGFEEESIGRAADAVTYYRIGAADGAARRLVVYLQGSDPSPQFSYIADGESWSPRCWIPRDYETLLPSDVYVVIEKVGFNGVFVEGEIEVPDLYHERNSLDDRVSRADVVISRLASVNDFQSVVVYGHSEGAPVAAKLATANEHITHLGFWAGNALPDFFDAVLGIRAGVHSGELSGTEAQAEIDMALQYFSEVVSRDREGTEVDDFGYTNKRWWSYAEPPINHLLALDIPIYVQVATDDESAPIESTYLIPLEFARQGKSNLSYNVCMGCDHGFFVVDQNGQRTRRWAEIFADFMAWVGRTPG
ncbi:MAG: hypothetical protein AAGB51_10560 [Planctomycetota bacterium]